MTTTMSLLFIRRVLTEFCEENGLSLRSAVAVEAASYLIKVNCEDIPSAPTLRSSLDSWIAKQATAA